MGVLLSVPAEDWPRIQQVRGVRMYEERPRIQRWERGLHVRLMISGHHIFLHCFCI